MDHSLASEIAKCIIAAWALAVLAQLFGQPLILAYLAAGFACGPHGLGLVQADEHITVIAEIGLSLLLFMVGLEIDLRKMLRAGRVITLVASVQILGGYVLSLLVFLGLGFALGHGRLDALYLAVAVSLSSTVIIVKILYDKRELDTLPGRLTLGILVIQDLCAILFLALRPHLHDASLLILGQSLFKVVALVAFAFGAEIERSQPALLAELAVIDFNPVVIQRLRQRGIKVIYGDISKRETLLHAGVGRAEVLVCTLPDAILKGTTNVVHVRQLREINPTARIIVTGDSFAQIDELYQAGADYVRVPRITEATELCAMLAHALGNDLGPRRVEMEARLADRNEVLP